MRSLILMALVLLTALPGNAAQKQPSLKESLLNFKIALGAARSSVAALDRALNPNVVALPDLGQSLGAGRQLLQAQTAKMDGIQADFKAASDYLARAGGSCNVENTHQVDKAREAMALAVVRSREWGSALARVGEEAGKKIEAGRVQLGPNQQGQSARAKALVQELREKTGKIAKAMGSAASQQGLSPLHRLDLFCQALKPKPALPKDPRMGGAAPMPKAKAAPVGKVQVGKAQVGKVQVGKAQAGKAKAEKARENVSPVKDNCAELFPEGGYINSPSGGCVKSVVFGK